MTQQKSLFKTQYNADEFPNDNEKIVGKSMTVPDQTMSVRELLERYHRGLPLGGEKVPIYDGEEDYMPDLATMDLADRQAYLEETEKELSRIKKSINEKSKKQRGSAASVPADKAEPQVNATTTPPATGPVSGGGDSKS